MQAAAKKEVAALLALKADLEKAEAGCVPPSWLSDSGFIDVRLNVLKVPPLNSGRHVGADV